jgi:hypothetical protein
MCEVAKLEINAQKEEDGNLADRIIFNQNVYCVFKQIVIETCPLSSKLMYFWPFITQLINPL